MSFWPKNDTGLSRSTGIKAGSQPVDAAVEKAGKLYGDSLHDSRVNNAARGDGLSVIESWVFSAERFGRQWKVGRWQQASAGVAANGRSTALLGGTVGRGSGT